MAMDTIRDLARVFDPLRLATRVLLTTSRALSSVPGTPHAYPGMRIKQIQADDLPFLQLVVDELGGDPNDPGSFHHRLRGIVRLANLYRLRFMAGGADHARPEELEVIEAAIKAIAHDLANVLAKQMED